MPYQGLKALSSLATANFPDLTSNHSWLALCSCLSGFTSSPLHTALPCLRASVCALPTTWDRVFSALLMAPSFQLPGSQPKFQLLRKSFPNSAIWSRPPLLFWYLSFLSFPFIRFITIYLVCLFMYCLFPTLNCEVHGSFHIPSPPPCTMPGT